MGIYRSHTLDYLVLIMPSLFQFVENSFHENIG